MLKNTFSDYINNEFLFLLLFARILINIILVVFLFASVFYLLYSAAYFVLLVIAAILYKTKSAYTSLVP